ncbi:hypothetical protein MPLSOD_140243 [Mesorhizobium sp. SOD10]|nr:hypothetical protein MPLSOD_140243 [Mesorhizobium sp. SOD10]
MFAVPTGLGFLMQPKMAARVIVIHPGNPAKRAQRLPTGLHKNKWLERPAWWLRSEERRPR